MIDLWNRKVTIYNDIPSHDDIQRQFKRFVIDKCQIHGSIVDKAKETIRNVVYAQTVISKDIEHYKSPLEYRSLSVEEQKGFYTVNPGDFVVFAEVDDIVTDAHDYGELQKKYKNCGMKIVNVSTYIDGMMTDNITMTNA